MNKTTEIIRQLNSGIGARDIANNVKCSISFVYKVAQRNNVKMHGIKSKLEQYDSEVRQMREAGCGRREIAERFNCSLGTVSNYCNEHSIESRAPRAVNKKTDEEVRQNVHDVTGGALEYVRGYTRKEDPMTVRCSKCSHEFVRSYTGIVHKKHVGCPECKRVKAEARRQAEEQERAERQAQREKEKAEREAKKAEEERQKAERKERRRHACPVCGTETTRPKYCSDSCKRKATNKQREIKRRKKIQDALVDNDITVKGLFKRDGGTCYLCGKPCRLDDYIIKNGTTICGDWYPSIDHVIPLAHGGEHSWKNVRLAHRICNSLKSDERPPRIYQ